MDLSSPDGTGNAVIASVTIPENGTTYNVEGPIEGYGQVFITQYWQAVDADKTRATMSGEARVLGDDGGLLSSPLRGTFRRNGT
jgi:hypothetical protein